MKNRLLTGNYYLKPRRWFGYNVMVEVEIIVIDDYGLNDSPIRRLWQKAKFEDIAALGLFNNTTAMRSK